MLVQVIYRLVNNIHAQVHYFVSAPYFKGLEACLTAISCKYITHQLLKSLIGLEGHGEACSPSQAGEMVLSPPKLFLKVWVKDFLRSSRACHAPPLVAEGDGALKTTGSAAIEGKQ